MYLRVGSQEQHHGLSKLYVNNVSRDDGTWRWQSPRVVGAGDEVPCA